MKALHPQDLEFAEPRQETEIAHMHVFLQKCQALTTRSLCEDVFGKGFKEYHHDDHNPHTWLKGEF